MLSLAVVAVLMAFAARYWSGPVHPQRITAFARRHALAITPGAEPVVRHYLRTTRVWRAPGLVAGLFLTMPMIPFTDFGLPFGMSIDPFSGWFLGVLGAELAIGSRRDPGPVAAVTAPPRLLSPQARAFLYGGAALSAASLLIGIGVALTGTPSPALPWTGVGAAVTGGTLLLVRSLRLRPIPAAPADVVAAVLATRSRSAHTLATGNAVFAYAWGLVDVPMTAWGDLPVGVVGLPLVVGAFLTGTRQWAITVGPPATRP
ncbi:hypothetical protein [Streptosporangium sp. NPDC049376]|uniref:hypothetical protein n=1 Tax=Streptosporangium sp. NPDC049376 TaxID=3366192 RepID=UPI0037A1070D